MRRGVAVRGLVVVTLLGRKSDIEQYRALHPDLWSTADYLDIRGTMRHGRRGYGGWSWTRNKRFIRAALAAGGEIRLVTDPGVPLVAGGNTYKRELKFLAGLGYTWDDRDDHWLVRRARPTRTPYFAERFTADTTARSDAMTMELSTPTPQ